MVALADVMLLDTWFVIDAFADVIDVDKRLLKVLDVKIMFVDVKLVVLNDAIESLVTISLETVSFIIF